MAEVNIMKKTEKWVEKAAFFDPDYGTDVTDGVREVLRREHSDNIIGCGNNGELLKVGVSYVTRRGNRKNPVKYLLIPDSHCPSDDSKLAEVAGRVIDAVYTLQNLQKPYRAVSEVSIRYVERYADVSM